MLAAVISMRANIHQSAGKNICLSLEKKNFEVIINAIQWLKVLTWVKNIKVLARLKGH